MAEGDVKLEDLVKADSVDVSHTNNEFRNGPHMTEYEPDSKPRETIENISLEDSKPHAVDIDPGKAPNGEAKTLITGSKLLFLFIGLALAIFLAALDQTITSTATPKIVSDLGGFDQFSWVATAYLLTSTALQPLYGKFSDIFGRRPTMLFAIFTFEAGSLLCAVSQSMTMLIASRAIAGIGGAGLVSLVMIVISDVVNMRDRGKYQGVFGAVFGLASVVGPLLGGAFTDHVTWRWCFYINLPFGAITTLAVILFLDIPHKSANMKEKILRIDFFGVLTILPCVVALLLATAWGGTTYPWNSGVIIALYIVSGALLVAFVLIELYVAKEPILPMRLFRIRNFTLGMAISFFIGFCMLGSMIYLPVYFQVVKGYGATSSGLRMLPIMIGMVICSAGSGIAIAKTGVYVLFPIVGTAILVLGMGILSTLQIDSSFGQMVGLLIPTGVGLGLCMQTLVLVVQACVPLPDIAIGTAQVSFFRSIGSVVGVAVFGAIMNNQTGGNGGSFNIDELHTLPPAVVLQIREGFIKAVHLMFQTAIPFAGLGFITSIFIKWIPLRKTLGGGPPAME